MRSVLWFLGGVVVGAFGVAGLLEGGEQTGPAPVGTEATDHSSCRATEATMRTEVETLRSQSPAGPDLAPGALEGGAAVAANGTEAPEQAAYRVALAKVREQLRSIRDVEPGAAPVLDLLKTWREQTMGRDDAIGRLAGRALVRLAGRGKLRPEDVDALADAYRSSRPGAPGRSGLAATVARAWARDSRLADWLAVLPPVEEPGIRAAVVDALNESPSDAYREYLLDLSRTEQDHDVLEEAWNEDPITVALNKAIAPRLIEAIEARIAEGDLGPRLRARGISAIGLSGALAKEAAVSAMTRLLAAETHDGVRAFGRDMLEAVENGEANVQTLDGLWGKHYRSFAEE